MDVYIIPSVFPFNSRTTKLSGKTAASVRVGKRTSDEVNSNICITEGTRHKHFKSFEVLF